MPGYMAADTTHEGAGIVPYGAECQLTSIPDSDAVTQALVAQTRNIALWLSVRSLHGSGPTLMENRPALHFDKGPIANP